MSQMSSLPFLSCVQRDVGLEVGLLGEALAAEGAEKVLLERGVLVHLVVPQGRCCVVAGLTLVALQAAVKVSWLLFCTFLMRLTYRQVRNFQVFQGIKKKNCRLQLALFTFLFENTHCQCIKTSLLMASNV